MAKAPQSPQEFENLRKVKLNFVLFPDPKTDRQKFINSQAENITISTVGTNLLPSVVMAQAILETGDGATIKKAANNMFGFKATSKWGGRVISNTTFEYINKVKTTFKGTICNGFAARVKWNKGSC